jgi:D-alanine-D-alanine ligase-like ATP-grasp enzyme
VSDLSEVAIQMSLKAASVLRREIAGVDVMFEDVTNKPYILEVNASPQVGSGAFTEEKLEVYKNFFVQVLKNSIKSDIISD